MHVRYSNREAYAYMASRMEGHYVAVYRVLREVSFLLLLSKFVRTWTHRRVNLCHCSYPSIACLCVWWYRSDILLLAKHVQHYHVRRLLGPVLGHGVVISPNSCWLLLGIRFLFFIFLIMWKFWPGHASATSSSAPSRTALPPTRDARYVAG